MNVTKDKMAAMLAILTPQQRARLRDIIEQSFPPDHDYSVFPYPQLANGSNEGAAEELGLNPTQREAIRSALKTYWGERGKIDEARWKLSDDDEKAIKANAEKRRQLIGDLRKRIEAVLTPEQLHAFKDMAFQTMAASHLRAAARSKEQGNLGLSEQQKATLRQLDAEYFNKPEEIYGDLTDKALKAFTPAQQDMLRAEIDRRGW